MDYSLTQKNLISIFTLLLILILLYFPVLFLDRTLQAPNVLYMDNVLKSPPTLSQKKKGDIPPQIFNIEQNTEALYNFPINIRIGQIYRSGELPLWNSHQGLGLPILGVYESAAFFPLTILQSFFKPSAFDWFMIMYLWLGGVFMYFFLFKNTSDNLSSLFGATAYMTSGTFTWYIQIQHITSAGVMLPLVMLCAYNLTNNPTKKNLVLLSVTLSLLIYSGQPEVVFFCLFMVTCYVIFRIFYLQKKLTTILKHIGLFILSNFFAILLSTPLIFLFLQLFFHSFSDHPFELEMRNGEIYSTGLVSKTPHNLLPGIFFPNLINFPILPPTLPHAYPWQLLGSYIGIVPLFFIITGIMVLNQRYKKEFIFFLIFSMCFLMMNQNIPPFSLLGYLPIFRQVSGSGAGGAAWTLPLITASTYAFSSLKKRPAGSYLSHKQNITLISLFLLICFFCIQPTLLGYSIKDISSISPFVFEIKSLISPYGTAISSLMFSTACIFSMSFILKSNNNTRSFTAFFLILCISAWYYIPRGNILGFLKTPLHIDIFLTQIFPAILSIFFIFCVFLYLKNSKITAFVLSILIFISGVLYFQNTLPGYPKYEPIWKKTNYINFLEKNSNYQRIFGFSGVLTPSYATLFGLYDIRYTTPLNYKTFANFINQYIKNIDVPFPQWFDCNAYPLMTLKQEPFFATEFKPGFSKATSLLGVKYYIVKKTKGAEWGPSAYPSIFKNTKLVYTDSHVNIYENLNVLPRAFLVTHIQEAPTFQTAQALTMKNSFNMNNTAILENQIPNFIDDTNKHLEKKIQILHYGDQKVVINIKSNKPGLLVLSDIYYPGWHATIDGKEEKIYRVDGLIRGVFISQGDHLVIFYYSPLIFKIALFITSVVLFIFLLLLLPNFLKRKQLYIQKVNKIYDAKK